MIVMNPNQKSQQIAKTFSMRKAHEFLENVKQELSKIHWTDGQDVKVYAKVVVTATFLFGMLIYFSDLIIQKFLHSFDTLFRWIVG